MKIVEWGLNVCSHPLCVQLFSFILSFVVVYVSIPSIVKVAHQKRLYDEPGHRKSHHISIPNLGGIAIFAALMISIGIFARFEEAAEFAPYMAAIVVLFFIGIKDDILVIAPNKKLTGEILATLIVVIFGNLRLTNLHGFGGIHEIGYIPSVLLSVFVIIVIINAFNLTDGIDGLASSLGIISCLAFGIWFLLSGWNNYAMLSASLAGALVSFFLFNVFGRHNKVFMGDTGSLIVGFVISILAVKFNEANINPSAPYALNSAPAVSFGIVIVPLFDTLRVFSLRLIRKQSPFKPDKNHLHHRMLALGFSHLTSTAVLAGFNVSIVFTSYILCDIGIVPLTSILLSLCILFTLITEYFIRKQKRKRSTIKMHIPPRSHAYWAIKM
jgi:UDP-N-acetylmuramyl pentapeptide phosphotransferase/UDP-N-acetylglucosamine-1-phosphate transferase